MRRTWLILVAAGCGRVGFEPTAPDAAPPIRPDAAPLDATASCAAGFVPIAGAPHRYLLDSMRRAWVNAVSACAAYGPGHQLAILGDDAERVALVAPATAVIADLWWLGANDLDMENTWINVDGTPATFLPWADGEPNNVGNEDCLSLLTDNSTPTRHGFANDSVCEVLLPAICQCIL